MGLAIRVLLASAAVTALISPVGAHATPAPREPAAPAPAPATPAPATPPPATPGAPATASARPPARTAALGRCPTGLVALTFDDGPARHVTRDLVHILVDRHVPATFFMVGSRVQKAPHAARLVARTGFTIGNHTWSHARLTLLPDPAIRRELRRTARELRSVGIRPSTLTRPPYGEIDDRVRAVVRDLGLVPVLWTVDSGDWRGGSPRQIARSILSRLRPHQTNIVLQHDGVRNSPASVAAVPIVVRAARRRGYCFALLGRHGHVVLPRDTSVVAGPPQRVTAAADLRAVGTIRQALSSARLMAGPGLSN